MKANLLINKEVFDRYKFLKGNMVDAEFIEKLMDLYEESNMEETNE